MPALQVKLERPNSTSLHVHLVGVIDESSDLQEMLSEIDGDAVFHLKGIRRINSPGIMKWIEYMTGFTSKHHAAIEGVSYPMALQASCLSNLFAGADVRSCLAPFFCPKCQESVELLVTLDQLEATKGEPPPATCKDCGGDLDFDELETYFRFLTDDD